MCQSVVFGVVCGMAFYVVMGGEDYLLELGVCIIASILGVGVAHYSFNRRKGGY